MEKQRPSEEEKFVNKSENSKLSDLKMSLTKLPIVKDITYFQLEKNRRIEKLKILNIAMDKYTQDVHDDILQQRFDRMSKDRWKVYFINPQDFGIKNKVGIYSEEYKTPDYWTEWKSRCSFPMAFEYNLAYPTYNASVILGGFDKFLAIEAPSNKNAKSFLDLIDAYDVSYIVKLNSPEEYPEEDYYPYWANATSDCITIGTKKIKFISHKWPHKLGTKATELMEVTQRIFESSVSKFIAVSCRGGIGRTGTFIAAYVLFKNIMQQISEGKLISNLDINVDETVWEISIQRPFAITRYSQYMTLYRFVDNLINYQKQMKSYDEKTLK